MHIASGIIANSIATRQSLLLHCPWLPPDRIQIIYNGIDTRLFSPERGNRLRKELKLSSKEILIGFVGQLDERKGIDTLVKAYSRLTENIQDTVLYIVGEGALEKRLKDMAGKCRGKIVFAGYREDVKNVMGAIDMLVLPSLWEGFGFVLIEAMSAEKPVITTTASNMPEIVTHEKDGLLIPPSDTDALTGALRLLIQNPGLRVKMGREGRKKVLENLR